MAETNTPLDEWANGGTKTEPTPTKTNEGWELEESPPFENFNWQWGEWINRFNYLFKNPSQGWNALVDYNGAGQAVLGSDDNIYMSVQSSGPASTVQDPTTDVGDVFWQLQSTYLELGTAASRSVGTADGNVPIYASGQVLTGNVTGTAAAWTTARTITLTGAASGNASFDGSANFNLEVTLEGEGTMYDKDTGTSGSEFQTNAQNLVTFPATPVTSLSTGTTKVGSLAFAAAGGTGISTKNYGDTLVLGGAFSLHPTNTDEFELGTISAGTWKCLGGATSNGSLRLWATMWQRVA